MEEINRLDDKYEKRMSKLEEKLEKTDLKLERNNFLTEQNTKVMGDFSETLKELSKTSRDTSDTMKDISFVVGTLVSDMKDVKQEIAETNKNFDTKIEATNSRVDEINEKGKFDWMLFIKNKVIPSLLLIGAGGAIVGVIIKSGVF